MILIQLFQSQHVFMLAIQLSPSLANTTQGSERRFDDLSLATAIVTEIEFKRKLKFFLCFDRLDLFHKLTVLRKDTGVD